MLYTNTHTVGIRITDKDNICILSLRIFNC